MDPQDPVVLVASAEEQKRQRATDARDAFDVFEGVDGMVPWGDAVAAVADDLSWGTERATEAVLGLTDDVLDPVQVIRTDGERYVGIIDYELHEAEGVYTFTEYEDTIGKRLNTVCGRCVEQAEYTTGVFRAVEGQGRHDMGCDVQSLLDHTTEHYVNAHTTGPGEVDVAASLSSGTTISSNTAVHGGNQSSFNVEAFGTSSSTSGEVPKANGSGGLSMGTVSAGLTTKTVTSNTTTSGEDVIYADTSSSAITITLSDSDANSKGTEIDVVNIDGSNAVTVDTQSGQTIDPNGDSSKTLNNAGFRTTFTSDGTNWDAGLAAEFDSANIGDTLTDPAGVAHTGEIADADDITNISTQETQYTISAGSTEDVTKPNGAVSWVITGASVSFGEVGYSPNADTNSVMYISHEDFSDIAFTNDGSSDNTVTVKWLIIG